MTQALSYGDFVLNVTDSTQFTNVELQMKVDIEMVNQVGELPPWPKALSVLCDTTPRTFSKYVIPANKQKLQVTVRLCFRSTQPVCCWYDKFRKV